MSSVAAAPSRAVVVGGGPAGSLAAMVLAKRGWHVDVFERMDMEALRRKTSRQYPMVISPRAWLGLEEVGAPPSSLPCMQHQLRGFIRNGVTANMFPHASFCVDRAGLARDMAEAALRLYPESVTFHGGSELQGVAFDERRVTVRSKGQDGKDQVTQVSYDLLVGADGANSAVRRCLQEHQPGFQARTVLAQGGGYKQVNGLPIAPGGKEVVEGISQHLPGQYLYAFAPSPAVQRAEDKDVRVPGLILSMDDDGTLSGVFYRCNNFQPEVLASGLRTAFPAMSDEWVHSLVQQTQESAQPLSSFGRIIWCDQFHGPRTVLLGDSAHAMTSAMGQGCNLACESVRVFARAYDALSGDLDALPAAFSAMRVKDAHAMQTMEKMQVLAMPAAMTTGGVQLFGEGPMWLARLQARVVMLLPMAASMLLRRLLPFLQWPPMLTMFSKVANPDKTFSQLLRETKLKGAGIASVAGALVVAAAAAAVAALRAVPKLV